MDAVYIPFGSKLFLCKFETEILLIKIKDQ
jgi:hypothetical protein